MNRICTATLTVFVIFCASPAFALPAHTVIGDTFTTGDGTGSSGGYLPGNTTEIGSATWIGQHTFYSGSNSAIGGFQFGTNTRINHVAYVPGENQTISVHADVIPPNGGSGQDWAAIVLAKDPALTPDSAVWTPGVSQLYLALGHDGHYFANYNGTNAMVDTYLPSFDPNVFHHLELIYDKPNNVVSAKIDGATVLSNFDLGSFTPDINSAGFQFYRWQLHGQYTALDNFAITAIPEPATAAFLVMGACCLSALRRKRS